MLCTRSLRDGSSDRLFVSDAEKAIQRRLQVAEQLCQQDHHGLRTRSCRHGHNHSHGPGGDCDGHDSDDDDRDHDGNDDGDDGDDLQAELTADRARLTDSALAAAGARWRADGRGVGQKDDDDNDDDDEATDSDEELLRMGLGDDDDALDGDVDGDAIDYHSSAPGGAAARAATARRLAQLQRDEFLRRHLAAVFTRDLSEGEAVAMLTHTHSSSWSSTTRSSSSSSSSSTTTTTTTTSTATTASSCAACTSVQYPVVCLVHRLHSFVRVEPTQTEASLDAAVSRALCGMLSSSSFSNSVAASAASSSSSSPVPFTYLRVGVAGVLHDAPLRSLLASQSLADVSTLPALVVLRDPAAPARALCGAAQLEREFGQSAVAATAAAAVGGGGGAAAAGAEATDVRLRTWLERIAGLSPAGVARAVANLAARRGKGGGLADGGLASTHHAASDAWATALRGDDDGQGDDERDKENPFCGRKSECGAGGMRWALSCDVCMCVCVHACVCVCPSVRVFCLCVCEVCEWNCVYVCTCVHVWVVWMCGCGSMCGGARFVGGSPWRVNACMSVDRGLCGTRVCFME